MNLNVLQRLPFFIVLLLVGIGVFLNSCSEDQNPALVPTINTITPVSGQVGTPITISGKNMGANSKIYFAGANNSSIIAPLAGTGNISGENVLYTSVPEGAVSGKIKVEQGGATGVSANDFTVITPVANLTISPTSGSVEST